jgi:hypothetical protein
MMELRPLIVDEKGVVLGGNQRLRALNELGFTEIPDTWVKRADKLTESEKREFLLRDNISSGQWDWEILANNFDHETLAAWDLEPPDIKYEDEPEKTPKEKNEIISYNIIFNNKGEYDRWLDYVKRLKNKAP